MIRQLDVNTSGIQWEIAPDGKTLIQPLSSIKGLGEKAIEQIIECRPFNTAEALLFSEEVSYSKLNKKALSALAKSGALDDLVDDRFIGTKHFWTAVVEERPKNLKQLKENIEKYKDVGEFSNSEKIENITNLTGIFPFELVLEQSVLNRLDRLGVPPLGEWDQDLGAAWFVPREVIEKKTKNGKMYWIIKTTDTTSTSVAIKCWGIRESDQIILNHPYMAKLDYDEQWGFSTRSIRHNFRLLG